MIDKFQFALLTFVLKAIAIWPLRVLYVLSDLIYPLVYYIVGYRREVVRKNLTHSFPEKTEQEIKEIEKKFYRHFCDYVMETVKLMHISDEEMRRLYDTVLAAQQAALEAAAIGVPHRALDKVARDLIENAGYVNCFGHSLGHGVGLDIHESPRLSSRAPEDALLTAGEIVTVEPGIYLQGKYGCRIEDMIAVTENGVENLTHSTKALIEL